MVDRLKRGDRAAAAEIWGWYADKLYRQAILPRLGNPELAQDVLKDTFRLALERIGSYESRDRSIFFWLRRIAVNRAIDVHRAHQRDKALQERLVTGSNATPAVAEGPDLEPEAQDTKEQVEISLSRMNPRYAQALRLRLIEDRDRDECAQILGVTIGNFDVILHRAAQAFRKVFPP